MNYLKKGFLNKDFQVFYINDNKGYEFEYHFHEFNKIIVFLNGNVNYIIEGRGYKLKPYDILIVRNNEIHKPEIDKQCRYERIVVWINNFEQLNSIEEDGIDLMSCFDEKHVKGVVNLFRYGENLPRNIKFVIEQLKEEFGKQKKFGNNILKRSLFIQLMIYINRTVLSKTDYFGELNEKHANFDITIQNTIDYINLNLKEDLSVDKIAESLFISKYHLMRKFKQFTGYTLHLFVVKKRLLYAKDLIKKGKSTYVACIESGFLDYSTFIRAYKKHFDGLPSEILKSDG